MSLIDDFSGFVSAAPRGAGYDLPHMRLYVDAQPRWYWEGGVNWVRAIYSRRRRGAGSPLKSP